MLIKKTRTISHSKCEVWSSNLIYCFLFLALVSYVFFFGIDYALTTKSFLQIFRLLMRINSRVLLVLLLFGLGALIYIGASTSPTIVFVYSVCIISFLVSMYLAKWVLAKDEGPPEMVQVFSSLVWLLFTMFCLFPLDAY